MSNVIKDLNYFLYEASKGEKEVTSWRTAVPRKKMSAPMRFLLNQGLLIKPGIDSGCGQGFDAKEIGFYPYDPYWRPKKPNGKFKTVTSIYVLNTLPANERQEAIDTVIDFLDEGGTAYIAVRRDKMVEGPTPKGYQYTVNVGRPFELFVNFPRKFSIYRYKK